MKSSAIAALALISGTDARMWFGACPKVTYATNVDPAKFAGNWYEWQRDNLVTMDMGQTCTTAASVARPDGKISVQYRTNAMFEYRQSPVLTMDCSTPGCTWVNEAKSEEERAEKNNDYVYEYGILATDNDNFHVMYVCGESPFGKMAWLNIMGKTEQYTQDQIDAAYAAITAANPDWDMNPLFMKDGGQGSGWFSSCEYEWNLDQDYK